MNPSETPDSVADSRRRLSLDWLVGLFLFAATATIVVWQNCRLSVLWDLSYVLENSYRISLGDIPYRDFPFPYPPLTFLIQAAIIKLTGRVFWHHIVYCALLSGFATVVTWRILLNLLRETVAHAYLLALLLSLPLILLGIYCIFPHPFYDPDCTFAILLSVFLLQQLERRHFASWRALLVGAMLMIPLFVKQNTGLAFIVSAGLAFVILMTVEAWHRRSARRYLLIVGGAIAGLVLACSLIHLTAGLSNYWHWTFQFAASRRTPARAEMIGIYEDKTIVLWIVLIAAGAIVLWLNRSGSRLLAMLSGLLIAAPFAWPTIYLLREQDPSERAERLLTIWPVLIIVSLVVSVASIKKRKGLALVLPFILIGAIHGAFMSQQLWGSTYAIWPLFMILLAGTIGSFCPRTNPSSSWTMMPLTAVVVVSLLISGGFYVWSHERLSYANLEDGELTRSTLPQLKGLSIRGDWIPNFEELVRYSETQIPRDYGLLLIPGEDPFYYTTGRRPRFPVLLFDQTVNPYAPEEVLKLARERDIRWLIVKQDLQDEDEGLEKERDELTEVLEQDFEQVESLNNYDVYRRKEPEADEDEDKNQ